MEGKRVFWFGLVVFLVLVLVFWGVSQCLGLLLTFSRKAPEMLNVHISV